MVYKTTRGIFFLVFLYLSCYSVIAYNNNCVQPVKKISLKKEPGEYFFCIDFQKGYSFVPRIHTLPNGFKIFLSFDKQISPLQSKKITHPIIKGCCFNQFGASSSICYVVFKEGISITKKKYTKNSIKIGFKINKKRLIILDPGHGGQDTGVKSFTGDYEKNITLVAAIELRDVLLTSGRYKVALLRDGDFYCPINAKLKNINRLSGEALISIHTNNDIRNSNAKGISVNIFPPHSPDVSNNINKSEKLSQALLGWIPDICKAKKYFSYADLKVINSGIPSIMIKLGFLSNKRDTELLHNKMFREKVNYAILHALDDFFKSGNQ